MANKQSFTPEEWTKILESTMLAGMAVSAADPSGVWGLVKEGFASSSALAAAKSDAGSSELVKAIIADYETSEGRSSIQEALRKRFAGAKAGRRRSALPCQSSRGLGHSQCQGTQGCTRVQSLAERHQPEGCSRFKGRWFPRYRRRAG